jgi:DNA invertase Pin-like site-specific DNA recombinase
MMKPPPKTLRCAVYTRVSTDYGLEQDFNSLDAQREAAAAYVKSQTHEGWRVVKENFDDGGFSGGSLERPALQRLLSAIRSRLIDVVVVYKVDRLTRSLADFAKLVEIFDEYGVSFVSVTQAFNTTTSMGRLTLNVLLSFAQFEREVTGERIRDKIAASKKKGLWMGGQVPLGYRVEQRKLVVQESEAEVVRTIFRRYQELGSLGRLIQDLDARGITTKQRRLANGSVRGGIAFTRGPLAYLLSNRTYLGEIAYRDARHEGEHAAIGDRDLFEAVQERLRERSRARRSKLRAQSSALTGRIFDDRGNRMTPSHAQKMGARYRYYVSCPVLQGRRAQAGSVARVPAPEIEATVLDTLKNERGPELSLAAEERPPDTIIAEYLERVVVRRERLEIFWKNGEDTEVRVVPWHPAPHTRKRAIIAPPDQQRRVKPIRAEARARLLTAIAKARLWVDELVSGNAISTEVIARRERCSERAVRMTLPLAFLNPDLIRAAVEGTLPDGVGLSRLTELPACWTEQHRTLPGREPVLASESDYQEHPCTREPCTGGDSL